MVFWWVGWASTVPKVYSRHMNRAVSFIFTFRVKRVRFFFPLEEKICFFSHFFCLGRKWTRSLWYYFGIKEWYIYCYELCSFPHMRSTHHWRKAFWPTILKKIECHHFPQARFMLTHFSFEEPGSIGVSMTRNSPFLLTFVSPELWEEGIGS